jgi:broad specificity phosphatase PhoE
MLIYFVRHGQTDWNKALRWQGGNADIQLNATGREQARAVRDWFLTEGIMPGAILSSPMLRARTTAECIAAELELKVILEPTFREVGLGEFEGKTTDELQRLYGDKFSHWLAACHVEAAPGGESLEQAVGRMKPALMSHIGKVEGPLIIVAHQAILMGMKAALSGVFSPEMLSSYKQANYEIDVWDRALASLIQRIDIGSQSSS